MIKICLNKMILVYDSSIKLIKHDFPFINIRKVPREVLKPKPREVLKIEGEAQGFQHFPSDLANDNDIKIMFDRYYCKNSKKKKKKKKKHCKNEEKNGALYFITSSHFPTRVRFRKYA